MGGKCLDCPPGTYSLPGMIDVAECRPCPLGFFSSSARSTGCQSCGGNTTTLLPRATTSDDCLCGAGFRLSDPRHQGEFPSGGLDCVRCAENEWCIPGNGVAFWTVSLLCGSSEQQSSPFCTGLSTKVPPSTQGKCIGKNQCPSLRDFQRDKDSTGCRFPYKGVKCRGCASRYGRSLIGGLYGDCVSCVWHYVVFAFFIVLGSVWVIWISVMLVGRSVSNPAKGVVLMRTFWQHWQQMAVLRYMNVTWPAPIRRPMQILTMGIPLAEMVSCFFKAHGDTTDRRFFTGVQMMCFFPLAYLLWSFLLIAGTHHFLPWVTGYVRKQKKNESPSSDFSALRVTESTVAQQPWLAHRSSIVARLWSSRAAGLGERSPLHFRQILSSFAVLYATFFVSSTSGLFYGIQCVFVEATGVMHALAALDEVCGNRFDMYPWSITAICLWVWVTPLAFLALLWFRGDRWSSGRKHEGWGYFLHGYRRETVLWQSIVIFRLMIMVTVAGLSGPYSPQAVFVAFGTREMHKHRFPADSEYGSFPGMCGIALAYFVTEVFREFFSVTALGAPGQFLPLSRVSMASIMLTLSTAMLTKVYTRGILRLSTTVNSPADAPRSDSSTNSVAPPATAFVIENTVEYQWSMVCGILALMGHLCFLISAIYNGLQLLHFEQWSLVKKFTAFRGYAQLRTVLSLSTVRSAVVQLLQVVTSGGAETMEGHLALSSADDQDYKATGAWFLPSLFGPGPRPRTNLHSLQRSYRIGVVSKEDILVAEACVERGNTNDHGQVIAALLRLTLEPYSRSDTRSKCLQLLNDEGFDLVTVSNAVNAFLDLRARVIERLNTVSEDKLVRQSWIARQYTLLRYPVLEDSSLQLIPPFPCDNETATKKDAVFSTEENGVVCNTQSDGVRQRIKLCGLWWLRGRRSAKSDKAWNSPLAEGVANLVAAIPVKGSVSQELAQRVVQCLFLDLSDFRYQIPRNVMLDRFLAAGVPPGTRNDGKTDSAIRSFQREIFRLMKEGQEKGRSEQEIELGRILRRRRLEFEAEANAQRDKAPVKVLAALQFAEKANEEQRRKKELETTVEVTIKFLQIFPDARRVRHSVTGQKDRTPDPQNMIRVFQDRTVFPRDVTTSKKDDESFASYLEKMLRSLQKELWAFTGQASASPNASENGVECQTPDTSRADARASTTPLLALVCVAGEFAVEPAEVNVFLAGNPQFVQGPDGTLTGISTYPDDQSALLNDIDEAAVSVTVPSQPTTRLALLDPIVEIAAVGTGNLVQGEADWTLECWIFLPKSFLGEPMKRNSVHQGISVRSLCASEAGDSLLSIDLHTGALGMWNSREEPPYCFQPFGPLGEAVHPVTLRDLEIPCWHFVTLTAECRREDPSDPASEVVVVYQLYVDGKLGGGIRRNWIVGDIEVVGNNVKGDQPFGVFAEFFVLPGCLHPRDIERRYKARRVAAENRLQVLKRARKKLGVLGASNFRSQCDGKGSDDGDGSSSL